jgi:hypothetical protein
MGALPDWKILGPCSKIHGDSLLPNIAQFCGRQINILEHQISTDWLEKIGYTDSRFDFEENFLGRKEMIQSMLFWNDSIHVEKDILVAILKSKIF